LLRVADSVRLCWTAEARRGLLPLARPAPYRQRLKRSDLVLGQAQGHSVGLDLSDRGDGDRDLTSSPEVAVLEDDVRDLLVPVDKEPIHMADVVSVGGGYAAGASDLDLSLGDAVVADPDVRIQLGGVDA